MYKIFLSSLVLLFLFSFFCSTAPAGSQAGHRIFYDDFSGEMGEKWLTFAQPGPKISIYRGNPEPSVDNKGDGKKNNGVMSKRYFHLSPGMVIRCDIFVSVKSANTWSGGSFGFPRDPDAFRFGVWPDWLIGMSYDYIGNLGWTRGPLHEEGTLICYLVDEDGNIESHRSPYRNRYLDGWHTYEITIRNDGFVEFRIDGELIYYSRKRFAYGKTHRPLLLGHRSGRKGKVYHDNVEVLSYKEGRSY